jgi:glycosyltransferase involved in cell wall biosynthesis
MVPHRRSDDRFSVHPMAMSSFSHRPCYAQLIRSVDVKIAFVLSSYYSVPSGGYKVVYEYANHLAREGNEVTVIYLRRLGRSSLFRSFLTLFWMLLHPAVLADEIKKPEVSWYSLHSSVKSVRVTDLEARQVPDADAIFATRWTTASLVRECPHDKGAKFYLVQDFPPWTGDKHELEQTWRLPLKKVVISNWLAELVTQAGVPKEDIVVIHDAIDHEHFRILNSIRGRAKRVVMLYSQHAFKRSDLGLAALLKCKNAVPNLQASLFGPARKRPAELPSWIEYHGNVSESDLIKLYNSASIYLCSSAAESFALPPAEAMACGCAVATTDCGGNREYAEHEKTALVSDPDDCASLVNNVLRLLSDEDLRVKIALAGRDRISGFTWEESTQRLIAFVRNSI